MATTIYSPKDIFEQEFKVSMRGFDRAEVDEFLDNVISDYELFLAEIERLKVENARLRAENQDLVTKPKAPVAPPAFQPEQPAAVESVRVSAAATNFDILKRISRLELEVFGKQITE